MRTIAKCAAVGASIGCVAVTVFAAGEMLGHPDAPATPVVLILALAMGGLMIGTPAGGVVGAVVGWVKSQRETGVPTTARQQVAQATFTPAPITPQQREAVRGAAERQAQRQGQHAAAPLAPIAPAPQRAAAPERVDLSDPERLNRVLAKLDNLVGLESVAQQVREYAQRVAFEVQRSQALGIAASEIGMHALFVGPPGVAKTTVARIWSEALCALGLLPTDRVTEVGRRDLVVGHIGGTAEKTGAALERARGGVFFLDEAYSLAPQSPQDFGPEAVAEILTYMENHRTDLCVIAAGYEDRMEQFLDINPGLPSRFSERIVFPSYDAPTLVEITVKIAAEARDEIEPEARTVLLRGYQRLVAAPPKEWANGRSAREVLNSMRTARAVRLGPGAHDRLAMTVLTAEDASAGLGKKFPQAV